MAERQLQIDIFCHVVDNFGDIGVCWRLARQLRHDQNCDIRLIVDNLDVFQRIEPRISIKDKTQTLDGIIILHWDDDALKSSYDQPGDAVIESFACALPEWVIARMVKTKPVWIDLEYLSAEKWVEDCHAIPSHHPQTGLTKTLFFPGLTERTGGLLRDTTLIAERDLFQASTEAQNAWRIAQGYPPIEPGVVDISFFYYPDAPIAWFEAGLDRACAQSGVQVRLLAPGKNYPFLTQADYSRLLWTCDVNFVRGEDSFTQALWAAKPLIWHIYRQDENAHMVKLRAFLDLYGAEMLENFMILWNERGLAPQDAPDDGVTDWFTDLHILDRHARNFTAVLEKQPDLATNLVTFIRQAMKEN